MKYFPGNRQLTQFLIQIESMIQLTNSEKSIMDHMLYWVQEPHSDRVLIQKPDHSFLAVYCDINRIMHMEHEPCGYLDQVARGAIRGVRIRDFVNPEA